MPPAATSSAEADRPGHQLHSPGQGALPGAGRAGTPVHVDQQSGLVE